MGRGLAKSTMKTPFLESKRLILHALKPEVDLCHYLSWINDQETTRFMGSGRFPNFLSDLKRYISHYRQVKDGMLLGIATKKGRKHIGNITLHQIDNRNQLAEIGVIIGQKTARGKGYAQEAIRLVAEHAFMRLNLNKVCAGIVEGNEASKRAFEKVGFKVEGRLKHHFYLDNQFLDVFRLGLLRKDYVRQLAR
ncbi:MAG: GNAT family N-acetyltransferase [Candidatus Omnitrophica bacterium CG11_big_fil_rev_8_21_14_0_20_45_26]|uniref:GNAT family N-acetyltransferase n=1 Tax=Candidatus Abzuiibacterium crystallinum TaxID=1974748 RepID=A0A2H0LLE3_9BACT|nr:MAG: GNAT family N-acetyltransferase [Candidatus Omnitrophica bacterium CG11_big_fil_rev_8_21_14_0_20_45_26]PIW65405.1 MAG: N-acetyltransferase [Candidatus Omnitrophica bacterium CG12_big_fil_rev_8_21_14_0_65_45_16]